VVPRPIGSLFSGLLINQAGVNIGACILLKELEIMGQGRVKAEAGTETEAERNKMEILNSRD